MAIPRQAKTYGQARCKWCGELFEKKKSPQVFCSEYCRRNNAEAARKARKARGEAAPLKVYRNKELSNSSMRRCHTCGKPTYNYWCNACREKRIRQAESF